MQSFCATKIWVCTILLGFWQVSSAATCSRPKDFSNRAAAELYDKCVEKNGFTKIQKNTAAIEKIGCLHAKPSDLIACRKKELSGESIKTVSVAVFGATPTPAPKLKPLDGDVPVEDNTQKKPSQQELPKGPNGEPLPPVSTEPPAGAPLPPQPGAPTNPQ